jgi:hypothetical protein
MSLTAPTKPVMDVAVPKRPAFATAAKPTKPAHSAPARAAVLAVRPVSLSSALSAPTTETSTATSLSAGDARPLREQRSAAQAFAQPQHRTPVALITVTIFAVLVLSAIAVTVYVTSRTA